MALSDDLVIYQALEILEGRLKHGTDILTNPRDVRHYLFLNIADKEREMFAVLFLNQRHRLIAFDIPFMGTIDSASVHTREVVKLCLAHNAAAVIVAHNHPSHNPEPSASDIRITEKLKESLALIDVSVLDHFVIGGTQAVSMAERGLL